jgi:hypothetical protein
LPAHVAHVSIHFKDDDGTEQYRSYLGDPSMVDTQLSRWPATAHTVDYINYRNQIIWCPAFKY